MSNDCINDVSSAGRERLADGFGSEIMNRQVNARGIRLFKGMDVFRLHRKDLPWFQYEAHKCPRMHSWSSYATAMHPALEALIVGSMDVHPNN